MIPPSIVENAEEYWDSEASAARGAAVGTESDPEPGGNEQQPAALDSDLAAVVERWPALPESVRMTILALVRSAQ